MGDEAAQASIEVVAGVPLLLAAALVCLQLLAAGYTLSLADGAVEAGAVAIAADADPEGAVAAALPGWARKRSEVEVDGGRVTVRLRPPSPLAALGRALEVSASVWVRPPEGR